MRLMVIGHLNGHISQAGKIALQRGAKVIHCEDTIEAIGALLNGRGADLIMVDVKQKIADFVKELEASRIHVPIIACGIDNDARAAVKAIQAGAKEYVPLPPDADLIAAILEAVSDDNSTMIADDPSMKPIVDLANKIAPSEATIMITGESGTGKEVMSAYIHNKSPRKDAPFIAVNCAAIPENLLESELFGHEKGAFTGATARRIGKFEEAHKGTLLLDEVSEMHPLLQAKLLRAIQEKEITRIGSNKPVKVDVRIIATSNRNLEQSVEKGEFREDLYFRLNVVNIPLPALRERPSDIPKLAQFFADKYADANGVPRKKMSAEASDLAKNHSWRGNIRELENTMHRAILMSAQDEIEASALLIKDSNFNQGSGTAATPNQAPSAADVGSAKHVDQAPITQPAATEINDETAAIAAAASVHSTVNTPQVSNPNAVEGLIGRTIADVERDMIIDTLEHCLGNRTHAANILGISIRTLRNKINQYKDEGHAVPSSGN